MCYLSGSLVPFSQGIDAPALSCCGPNNPLGAVPLLWKSIAICCSAKEALC